MFRDIMVIRASKHTAEASMLSTGVDMMVSAGACRSRPRAIALRRSVSVTMPQISPEGSRKRREPVLWRIISLAAAWMLRPKGTLTGSRLTSPPTGLLKRCRLWSSCWAAGLQRISSKALDRKVSAKDLR